MQVISDFAMITESRKLSDKMSIATVQDRQGSQFKIQSFTVDLVSLPVFEPIKIKMELVIKTQYNGRAKVDEGRLTCEAVTWEPVQAGKSEKKGGN